jgi:two-component system response regulator HydG
MYRLIGPVARSDMSVLLRGASGTGKEHIAAEIHERSLRRHKPFVAVDCGAVSDDLVRSEFFGYCKGAFTGADSDKAGLFQAAEGGTLFLDEIGNLAPVNQMKLLRALQEKRYLPVGTVRERAFDIRLIAATNADLEKAVAEGSFREDLYHRLNEFTIRVPLLSECGEDILPLAEFFLKQFSARYGKSVQGFDREAAAMLRQYGWPGNIRELKNTVRRAVVFAGEGRISAQELNLDQGMKLGNMIVCPEKEEQQILRILGQTGNNRTLTARVLGISRTALYYKLRKYGIV